MSKYVRFAHAGGVDYGRLIDDYIEPLHGTVGQFEESARSRIALSAVTLLAPSTPSKIISIGPNFKYRYQDGTPLPERPMIWTHPASALNGPEGVIELPPGLIVNHETELAVVIGRTTKCVSVEEAEDYIFGYTCMNDVTAGDFGTPGAFGASHFFIDGKVFDTFSPIGPCIVTDLDTRDLHLESRVNGEVRQSHSTSDFIFSPAFVVALVSDVMTLFPGDVVSLGSPPGLGPIHDGDVVEVEVENIGVLRNYARARQNRAVIT